MHSYSQLYLGRPILQSIGNGSWYPPTPTNPPTSGPVIGSKSNVLNIEGCRVPPTSSTMRGLYENERAAHPGQTVTGSIWTSTPEGYKLTAFYFGGTSMADVGGDSPGMLPSSALDPQQVIVCFDRD